MVPKDIGLQLTALIIFLKTFLSFINLQINNIGQKFLKKNNML